MRKEPRRVANTPRVERTERLEGSQTSPRRLKLREATSGKPLCSLAALSVGKQAAPGNVSRWGSSMGRLYPPHGIDAMGKTWRWAIPGSRLLPTDRAAIL